MNCRIHPLTATVAIAALLAGCNPAYKRPSNPDVARIRFVPTHKTGYYASMNVYAHDGDDCGTPKKIVGLGAGLFNFGGNKKSEGDIGMPKDASVEYKQGQYFETAVEGGKPFYLSVACGQMSGACYLTGSFVPASGADYEVTYDYKHRQCYLRIERLGAQDGRLTRSPEPTSSQRPTSCTFFWN